MSFDAEIDERRALLRLTGKRPGSRWGPILRARHLVRAQLIAVNPAVVVGIGERWGKHQIVEFMIDGVGKFVFPTLTLFAVFCPVLVLIRLATEFPREKWALWAIPLSVALTFVACWALLRE